MKLNSAPFERIINGSKTIEIRLYDEKRQKLCVGDCISFYRLPEVCQKVDVCVKGLYRFPTFTKMLERFGMQCFGYPQDYSKEKFISECHDIYSEQDELKYGVLAIEVTLLRSSAT